MKRALALVSSLLFVAAAHAATAPPKVVFIGDQLTYDWPLNNPSWINKGSPGVGLTNYNGTSYEVMARFQTDVVALHPQIVHIMVGSADADGQDDSNFSYSEPRFVKALQGLVTAAKAAKIQVILGLEPQAGTWGLISQFNSVVATVAAANNIPVVNYGDALCQCVTVLDGGVYSPYNTYLVQGQNSEVTDPAITPTGYALMSQMAATAIATLGTTLKGGYLQNLEASNDNVDNGPTPNVNNVPAGAIVQFTPVGLYSNGTYQSITDTSFYGATGTWSSSNPLVMYVSPTGLTYALSAGTTSITYTSPTGVRFSMWTMKVTAPAI